VTGDTLTVQAIRDFAAALSDDGEAIPHKRFWDRLEWQRFRCWRWRSYTSQIGRARGVDLILTFELTAP